MVRVALPLFLASSVGAVILNEGAVKLDQKVVLPSLNLHGDQAVPASSPWEFSVDHRQFYAPPAHNGQDISAYYGVYGHEDALTEAMQERRVGSEGRWHIFHLPEGPASLRVPVHGDRRHAFSELIQLKNGEKLHTGFPPYRTQESYVNPLREAARTQEKAGAELVDLASMQEFYAGVVGVQDDAGDETRSYTNPNASAGIEAYLKQQMESFGLTVCYHTFTFIPWESKVTYTVTNVVGFLAGQGGDSVTVGAHYDSRPFSGPAPGANDNGSGVAAMLAVLKAFHRSGYTPGKNVYFVGFAAEEAGLYGSNAFAEELQNGQTGIPEKCRIATSGGVHQAIALDEVGWKSPNIAKATVNIEAYDNSSEVMEHLAAASRDINADSLKVEHSNNPFGSDHMSWLKRGMKACLMINSDDEAYPGYHTDTDTMAYVDIEYTVLISRMILGGFMRMAAR